MSVSDVLLNAMRQMGSDEQPVTRLATVTGGTATTVTVQFDGEGSASSRSYLKTYAGAAVGDRAVMLRVGSTWVAVARIAAPVVGPTTPGDWSGTLSSNASQVFKTGGVATLVVNIVHGSASGANNAILVLPTSCAVPQNLYFWGVDSGSGGSVPMYLITTGGNTFLQFVFSRPAGAGTLGVITYVTTAAG